MYKRRTTCAHADMTSATATDTAIPMKTSADDTSIFGSVDSLCELKRQYYKLALHCHPDNGGTHDDMTALHEAYVQHVNRIEEHQRSASRMEWLEKSADHLLPDAPEDDTLTGELIRWFRDNITNQTVGDAIYDALHALRPCNGRRRAAPAAAAPHCTTSSNTNTKLTLTPLQIQALRTQVPTNLRTGHGLESVLRYVDGEANDDANDAANNATGDATGDAARGDPSDDRESPSSSPPSYPTLRDMFAHAYSQFHDHFDETHRNNADVSTHDEWNMKMTADDGYGAHMLSSEYVNQSGTTNLQYSQHAVIPVDDASTISGLPSLSSNEPRDSSTPNTLSTHVRNLNVSPFVTRCVNKMADSDYTDLCGSLPMTDYRVAYADAANVAATNANAGVANADDVSVAGVADDVLATNLDER